MVKINADEMRKIYLLSTENKYEKELNKIFQCIKHNLSKGISHYDYRISFEDSDMKIYNEKLQSISDYFKIKGFTIDILDIIYDEDTSIGIRIKIV